MQQLDINQQGSSGLHEGLLAFHKPVPGDGPGTRDDQNERRTLVRQGGYVERLQSDVAARESVEVHTVQGGTQAVQVQEDAIRPFSGYACVHHVSSDLDGGW